MKPSFYNWKFWYIVKIFYLRHPKKDVIDVWVALCCCLTDSLSNLLSAFGKSSTTCVNSLFIKSSFRQVTWFKALRKFYIGVPVRWSLVTSFLSSFDSGFSFYSRASIILHVLDSRFLLAALLASSKHSASINSSIE